MSSGSHLRTTPQTRFRRLPGTRHHPPAQSQDAVPESCRATGAEGRAIVADNDVSAPRSAVATSRGSCTSVPASGPTAVVTAEADTRTGMLATYGCSLGRVAGSYKSIIKTAARSGGRPSPLLFAVHFIARSCLPVLVIWAAHADCSTRGAASGVVGRIGNAMLPSTAPAPHRAPSLPQWSTSSG